MQQFKGPSHVIAATGGPDAERSSAQSIGKLSPWFVACSSMIGELGYENTASEECVSVNMHPEQSSIEMPDIEEIARKILTIFPNQWLITC